MSVSIIRGTNDKPAASSELASAMADCRDLSGQLFIGYPIVSTPEGRHRIDALLVSPDRGLVVFDLVEGAALGGYQARQDDSANRLEARLRTHREVTRGRNLAIPIHTLSFAPRRQVPEVETDDRHLVSDGTHLPHALRRLEWDRPDRHAYEAALSAIENISSIRKSLKPRSDNLQDDSRGERLRKLENSIATLDPDQSRAVIQTVEGVQRIRGLAGSGKTIVLALKAAYLHVQHPEWRIAVTFKTRSLKGHFRRLINNFSIDQAGEEPDWRNLRIVGAWGAPGPDDRDGLYYEFCRTHGFDYFDFGSAKQQFGGREFAAVCERAFDRWRQSNARRPLYDAILVDEAQDLPDSFLRICYELLHKPRRLVYAYDELQNLSGESVSSPDDMFGARADGTPRVRLDGENDSDTRDIILEKCYRNSRPVLVTAHALGFGIYREPEAKGDTGLVQMFDSAHLWSEIGYRLRDGELRDGSPVVLHRTPETSPQFLEDHSSLDDLVQFVRFKSKEEQSEWLTNAIAENLRQDELRHDDIVVINPNPLTTREEVGPIRSRLLDIGVQSHVAGVDTSADVFFREHADSVTFTGIHRAKGNEAGMVYIINAQDCHGRGRNLASIRNRLFVAITRSKAWVRVLGIGDGMRALEAEYDRLVKCDFDLRFTYPSQEQRQRLRIVHRDMTDAERRRVRKSGRELGDLVKNLESGNLRVEDLDEELLTKLKNFIGGQRR